MTESISAKSSIVAVVVTFNRKELLLRNIDALLVQRCDASYALGSSARPLDIMIIDNASTDGTHEALASYIESGDVIYRNTGENLGGAGGFNYGMRAAVLAGYDYLWIMDDDCLPTPTALSALVSADTMLGGDYGYLSSVVRWTDGSICKMNVQRHPLTRDITDFEKSLQPCTLASFVSLFVPAKIVVEVGLPIAEFFIWTDDWDFTRRISRKYRCYVVGESVVVHASKTNGAGTIVDDDPARLDRYRKIYRNDVVLYRQEGLQGYTYLFSRALYHMGRVMLHSDGDRLKKLGIILSSNIDGLRFRPQIEYIDATEIIRPEKTE